MALCSKASKNLSAYELTKTIMMETVSAKKWQFLTEMDRFYFTGGRGGGAIKLAFPTPHKSKLKDRLKFNYFQWPHQNFVNFQINI